MISLDFLERVCTLGKVNSPRMNKEVRSVGFTLERNKDTKKRE